MWEFLAIVEMLAIFCAYLAVDIMKQTIRRLSDDLFIASSWKPRDLSRNNEKENLFDNDFEWRGMADAKAMQEIERLEAENERLSAEANMGRQAETEANLEIEKMKEVINRLMERNNDK